MNRLHLLLLPVAALLALLPAAQAQSTFVIPPDINGNKTIVSEPPRPSKTLRVAIYDGPGSGDGGIENVSDRAAQLPGARITRLTPSDVGSVDLKANFDVIIFSGGSGSGQAKAIGEEGRAAVREFVRDGGGYVGVCAGAYLACSNFEWGLGILNARTISGKWRRGRAFLELSPESAGEPIFGKVAEPFKVRYANGPVIKPMGRDDIPPYTTVFTFKTETAENDTPQGIQIGSPAMAVSTFGKGRVFISSPHPENTPGLEHIIPRALIWASGSDLK